MILVDRGSMYCNNSGGACFFFDIDVKGGESVVISVFQSGNFSQDMISRMLQESYSGFHQCQRGRMLANISQIAHAYMLVIDGKYNNEDGMSTESM
jgi:hypothetical protein